MAQPEGSQALRRSWVPFHYAWVVLIASSVLSAINSTFLFGFGLLLLPISESTGWSRGQVSLAYSIQFVALGIFSVSAGWLSEKFGARKIILIGSVVFTTSMILSGYVGSMWQFYLFYGLLAGGARSVFTTPVHTTVSLWFRKKLGIAIGIVMAATGSGPLLFAPLIRYLITLVGWQSALVLISITGGSLMLVSSLFVRNRPSDMGLLAYGEKARSLSSGGAPEIRQGVFYTGKEKDFFNHARKTQPFIPLILIHFLGCVSHSIPLAHVVAMASDAGVSVMVAATVLGVVSGFSIVSRFGVSVLADLIGGKKALLLGLSIQASSILLLLVAKEPWQFFLFAVAFGIGYGGEMVVFPIINRQYYGDAPVGTVYGYQMLGAGLGMALGGFLGGFMFDLMGNYLGAIWLAAVVGFMGVTVVLRLTAPVQKRKALAV